MIISLRKNLCDFLIWLGLLATALNTAGCAPKIIKFNVTVPATVPAPEADVIRQQGTTHVCPGTSFRLAWAVKGRASVSASAGERYQAPACFSLPSPASEGTKDVSANATQLAGSCGDSAIFRVTASHSLWRRSGPCPGSGCPNADHEVILASQLTVPIGKSVGNCQGGAYEVTNTKAAVDWDDHYRVGTVSLLGTGVDEALEQDHGRTLTVVHDAKEASFSAAVLTSDIFRGGKVTGTWTLRLSGCASPPRALVLNVQADCSK